jgi:hypothetical protein
VSGASRGVVASAGIVLAAAASGHAQNAPPLTPWLHQWAEYTWLQILDRNGGDGGRFSERGLLRQFDERIDAEYRLDLVSRDFTLREEAEWRAQPNGVRWRAGSFTKRDMAAVSELKGTAHLGDRWTLGVRADIERSPRNDRAFLRAKVGADLGRGFSAFVESGLDPVKPGSDLETGVAWRHPRRPQMTAGVSVAVLDWFNDFIFINLDAAGASDVDSTLVYDRQPLAARLRFTVPLLRDVRLGAHGSLVRPSRVRTYRGIETDSGFAQEERMGFGGVLVEWRVTSRLRLAGLATYVRSEIDRTRLVPSVPVDAFNLTEAERSSGALMALNVGRATSADLRVLRVRRLEERLHPSDDAPDIDYADAAWVGRVLVTRRPDRGFAADVGVAFDTRGIERGAGELPGAGARVGWAEWRLLANIGWRFGDAASFLVGVGVDLDGDSVGNRFDGMRGRFVARW